MAGTHFKDYMLLSLMMMMMIWGVPCGCCPDDQKAALLEFESLYHGKSSFGDIIFDWNASISCCKWLGVTCDSRHQFVTGIDLMGWWTFKSEVQETGASSDVLTPLFRLTSLQSLQLPSNYIRGEIPPGIGNLTRLQALDLSDNHFSGPIPPHLFTALPHLQYLNCDENSVEGKIPIEIGNSTNLVELHLQRNKLSGEIPATLLQLNKLEFLSLQGNSLSGEIPSVQNMTRLINLQLDNNFLSGGIPTWLFESSTIRLLYLGRNKLTLTDAKQMAPKSTFIDLSLMSCNVVSDGIPIWLANQTNLKALDLGSNRITGTFPTWLAEMHLNELVLADNLLQGTLPPELALNADIQYLDLSKNNFEGEIFPIKDTNETKQDSNFKVINLSDNNFTGSLGTHISNMDSLSYLDLSRNQLSGQAFAFLCQQSHSCPWYINLSFNTFHGTISISSDNLEVLEVAHNNFSKISLPQNLESLKLLDLSNNRISGEIPNSLAQVSSLRILSLGNNLLQGSIPQTLSNLTSLQILDLSGNKLRGRVPNSFGNLTGMTHAPLDSLIVQFNWSDDPLPTYYEAYRGPSIQTPWLEVFWKTHHQGLPNKNLGLYTLLDLSNNQLSGEIPNCLGNLRSLKALNFSHNSLSGRIPATFGNFKELESLDLSHNNLSGEIPESMGTLLQITNLQLSDNHLSGRIPAGPQMDRMNDPDSYANNDAGLCGMQIRKPCHDVPAAPRRGGGGLESEEELWFSWMTAGIGYPAGFVTTVLGMYGFGYFRGVPEMRRRRRMMRRPAIRFR